MKETNSERRVDRQQFLSRRLDEPGAGCRRMAAEAHETGNALGLK